MFFGRVEAVIYMSDLEAVVWMFSVNRRQVEKQK